MDLDFLLVILFIGLSIISSAGKSKKARNQREQRMRGMQSKPQNMTTVTERTAPPRRTASQDANAKRKAAAEEMQRAKKAAEKAAAEKSRQADGKKKKGQAQQSFDWRELFQPTQKTQPQKKPLTQSASQTRKTLIEQKPDCEAHRPDREEREHSNHERVAASVKPISASVKPLRNVYENEEDCEHRIELNPNIQYQHRQAESGSGKRVAIQTDADSLLQGVIWSEILGKPKAYQRGRYSGR